MAIRKIFQLGNPKLYEISEPIKKSEVPELENVIQDLHDTLVDFRAKYDAGRAIASPQIGIMKRMIYMYIDKPTVFINPSLHHKSSEMIEVWDDCMCFPDLLVKVKRHKTCTISYLDRDWNRLEIKLNGDLSELLQHEYDHLDGILAVSKAIDGRSFALRDQRSRSVA